MIAWPEWMPSPIRTGYSVRPVDRRTKTDMEISGIYRVEFSTDECECTCSLILNREESAWFEAFEQGVLKQGSTWFDIPLWVAGQLDHHKVRFKDRPQAESPRGAYTTYTMVFDVSKRNLICPDVAEFLLTHSPLDLRNATRQLCLVVNNILPGSTNMPGL